PAYIPQAKAWGLGGKIDNVGAAGWRLEGNALQKLNDVSHLPDRYPEAMEKNMHERRDSAVDMPSL
ncbi:MAG: hypothetical protein OXU36_22470, partial [Candidatus Poribacteria bacterium]|nr:hypothetical protein [Candidatus Poribacteria bacterium]